MKNSIDWKVRFDSISTEEGKNKYLYFDPKSKLHGHSAYVIAKIPPPGGDYRHHSKVVLKGAHRNTIALFSSFLRHYSTEEEFRVRVEKSIKRRESPLPKHDFDLLEETVRQILNQLIIQTDILTRLESHWKPDSYLNSEHNNLNSITIK